jgi:hypothetical protein
MAKCQILVARLHPKSIYSGTRAGRIENKLFSVRFARWDTNPFEYVRETAYCVGPSTEPEKIKSIAWPPHAEYCDVTSNDSFRKAVADHLLSDQSASPSPCQLLPRDWGTDTGNVKSELLFRLNWRVWTDACSSIQAIDVRATGIGEKATLVSGAVGKHQNAFGHGSLVGCGYPIMLLLLDLARPRPPSSDAR